MTKSKDNKMKRIAVISAATILIILIAGLVLFLKDRHNKEVAAKAAAKVEYIKKLQTVVTNSEKIDSLLYDTSSRYYSNLLAEEEAQKQMAQILGQISSSPEGKVVDKIVKNSVIITRAVCQCSDSFVQRNDLLKAYEAAKEMKVDTEELKGHIIKLSKEN